MQLRRPKPRIARWWLQLQEFTFDGMYRPGDRMKHVDALSRNPSKEDVLRITEADWVLSGQLTDAKVREIYEALKRCLKSAYDKDIHRDYALRDGRIYRRTDRGFQWLVPQGMRHQVVKASHDDLGHFSVEKTLNRLTEHYWFPRMRRYVEKYISSCIRCLYNKKISGKKEGFLHPIPKGSEPMSLIHIDHLGPFPRSRRGNQYLVVAIDGFTKFAFLKAVKTTKTKEVTEFLTDVFRVHGIPRILVSDQGSAFTAKLFKDFCTRNNMRHILNAVATPRANGQVERLNRTVLSALLSTTLEEKKWDEHVKDVQFAINNVTNKTTGTTPSLLHFGYAPRAGGDETLLVDEISLLSRAVDDVVKERQLACEQILEGQKKQKEYFDKKREIPKHYMVGDLVLVEKREVAANINRMLLPPFSGPFVIKRVLPNDRYVVMDMKGSNRTKRKYERVIAVDKMKPWITDGGIDDCFETDGGEEDDEIQIDDKRVNSFSRREDFRMAE